VQQRRLAGGLARRIFYWKTSGDNTANKLAGKTTCVVAMVSDAISAL
jgi:hypothetical protein